MSTFALENIVAVQGCQKFYKLKVDAKCPIEEFVDGLESQYETEMDTIYAYMNMVANLQTLPYNKYHPLNKHKIDKYREYEFKTKHLRVYVITQPGGKIVVMGGYKNTQEKDLTSFRALKKQYVESLK